MHPPNNQANFSSDTKQQNRCMTTSKHWYIASKMNFRRPWGLSGWTWWFQHQPHQCPPQHHLSTQDWLICHRRKSKNLQRPHWPYQTAVGPHQKTGILSSICGRCQQSNHHGRQGANGVDACIGHGSNVGCTSKMVMHPKTWPVLELVEGTLQWCFQQTKGTKCNHSRVNEVWS